MKYYALLAASASVCMVSTAAKATEDGNQHYPVGVNTISSGVLPLPGMTEFYNYTEIISGDRLAGPDGQRTIPGFHVSVQGEAPRVVYTFIPTIGPFHYVIGVIAPFVRTAIAAAGSRAGSTSFGDPDFENYLYYVNSGHNLFSYFGLETYIPIGGYNKYNSVNIGRNYWGFAPNFNVTYNPTPRVELSATMIVEFSLKNKATNYQSGDLFDIDYGLSFQPLKSLRRLRIGFNGFVLKQFTDDEQNGVPVTPVGYRSTEIAIGPQLMYYTDFGGFSLKYQQDVVSENRPRDSRIWFEFAVPIGGVPRASGQ